MLPQWYKTREFESVDSRNNRVLSFATRYGFKWVAKEAMDNKFGYIPIVIMIARNTSDVFLCVLYECKNPFSTTEKTRSVNGNIHPIKYLGSACGKSGNCMNEPKSQTRTNMWLLVLLFQRATGMQINATKKNIAAGFRIWANFKKFSTRNEIS